MISRRLIAVFVALLILTPALAFGQMLTVKSKKVNFRSGPSTSKKITYSAEKYYPVKVVGKRGGWSKTVDFEGDTAWVLTRLMTSKTKGLVVKVKKANLRSHARKNSKVLFTAAYGAAFKYIKKSGDWILCQHADGDRGWVHKNLVWR